MKRYRDEERSQEEANQNFSGYLKQEMKRKQEKPASPKQEELRLMGGLNQYDRHAREFCFILSREADYKA